MLDVALDLGFGASGLGFSALGSQGCGFRGFWFDDFWEFAAWEVGGGPSGAGFTIKSSRSLPRTSTLNPRLEWRSQGVG